MHGQQLGQRPRRELQALLPSKRSQNNLSLPRYVSERNALLIDCSVGGASGAQLNYRYSASDKPQPDCGTVDCVKLS